MNYLLHLAVLCEIYLILALSLNLMVGYAGLLNLAHAASFGIGAYTTALLMLNGRVSFMLALFLGIVITVVVNYLMSLVSLRLKGDHFILATLGFQVLIFAALSNWTGLTRGVYGIPGIPRPALLGWTVGSVGFFFVLSTCVVTLVSGFLAVLFRSPFGRTIQAIRDDEIATIALGKNPMSFKVRSMIVASGCAAIAGALYATYVMYIDPSAFRPEDSFALLAMIVIGGTGNIKGPIIGAIVLVLLPELLRFLPVPGRALPNLQLIIYGALLIVTMRIRPQGIAGVYRFE
jgi:branched-chain amino acid transport system permease protein